MVDDCIDSDSGFTRLSVADNQLTLTSAYRNHTVDSLNSRLKRDGYGLSCDDTGSDFFDGALFLCENIALAVKRLSEGVYDASEQLFADRYGHD